MKTKQAKLSLILLILVFSFAIFLSGAQIANAETSQLNLEEYLTDTGYTLTAGDYILTSDIVTTQTITIQGTVTLNLNGHVIDGNNGLYSVITVPENATLTLSGTGANGEYNGISYTGGLITGGNGTNYGIIRHGQTSYDNKDLQTAYFGGGVLVKGTFNLQSGTIAGIDFSGISGISEYVRISASTTTDNAGYYNALGRGSGAVAVDGGIFNMSGGAIQNNQSTSQMASIGGGGVYVFDSESFIERAGLRGEQAYQDIAYDLSTYDKTPYGEDLTSKVPSSITGGTFNMTGGTISGNTSTNQDGGGVFVGAYSTFTASGGTISGNSAASGGGVELFYAKSATISGTNQIIQNESTDNGGGIYAYNSDLTISAGTINNNTASDFGGGIYAYESDITINGGAVNLNEASEKGGGIFAESNSDISMIGGEINLNEATNQGGGIFATTDSNIEISGGTINSNKASDNGGGIYASNVDVSISGGALNSNTSEENGGGIYASEGSEIEITSNLPAITYNNAKNGGGIFANAANATISGGSISHNTTTLNGGGAYFEGCDKVVMSGGEFDSNTAGLDAGGIGMGRGTKFQLSGGKVTNNLLQNQQTAMRAE